MKAQFLYSGICDEAGKDIDTQIRAHRELGWKYAEIRLVDGIQFTDLPDSKFEEVAGKLADAGIKVSCFASAIANWASKITDPFEKSTDTLARAIKRMQKLGTKYIRVMTYPNDGLSDDAWRDESVRRLKALARQAEEGGIVLAVENCDGWASQTPETYNRFFKLVDSPAVKAVYDTGNPAVHGDSTWEWYEAAKPHIAFIHVKAHTLPTGIQTGDYAWPDAGASKIVETLEDLMKRGYHNFVSIEPHLKAIVHENKGITDTEAAYQTYVEYGQRLMKLVSKIEAGETASLTATA